MLPAKPEHDQRPRSGRTTDLRPYPGGRGVARTAAALCRGTTRPPVMTPMPGLRQVHRRHVGFAKTFPTVPVPVVYLAAGLAFAEAVAGFVSHESSDQTAGGAGLLATVLARTAMLRALRPPTKMIFAAWKRLRSAFTRPEDSCSSSSGARYFPAPAPCAGLRRVALGGLALANEKSATEVGVSHPSRKGRRSDRGARGTDGNRRRVGADGYGPTLEVHPCRARRPAAARPRVAPLPLSSDRVPPRTPSFPGP